MLSACSYHVMGERKKEGGKETVGWLWGYGALVRSHIECVAVFMESSAL